MPEQMRPQILVLGASGMLGYAVASLMHDSGRPVVGTVRSRRWQGKFKRPCHLLYEVGTGDSALEDALIATKPSLVINCIAQRFENDVNIGAQMEAVNALYPHRLFELCRHHRAKLVHFSTDGVFDGIAGGYDERSAVDPQDDYGASKARGELREAGGALTIRTSMIGRSPTSGRTLVDWLLETGNAEVSGYDRAIFSGLPVTEIARFLDRHLADLKPFPSGLLHLAGEPISKFSLLRLIRQAWGFEAEAVKPDSAIRYDRSLSSIRSDILAGYRPPPWPQLIHAMKDFYETRQIDA